MAGRAEAAPRAMATVVLTVLVLFAAVYFLSYVPLQYRHLPYIGRST